MGNVPNKIAQQKSLLCDGRAQRNPPLWRQPALCEPALAQGAAEEEKGAMTAIDGATLDHLPLEAIETVAYAIG